jgi:general secretion pathway protein C
LARNPFDSITGPLDGTSSPVALPEPSDEAPLSEGTSEDDPACGFGRVILISASDDPSWSFAAIDDGKGKSQLRRVGDSVAGHTLQAMGWDRIWLAEGSKRCQLRLGVASASAPQGNAGRIVRPNKGPRRGARDLAPELAAKIHKVSDTEFNIERSVVDEILENQAQLMRSARIMPEKEGDNVVGIKLYGIREGSLLSHLGMSNGDRLDSINGFEMGDPQKALEAYGRLRSASSLKVQINRKGTPTTIEYNIQ